MCLRHRRKILSMAALDDLLPLGTGLERSYPVYVRGRLKFRVKQMVYVAFSLDETVMGFAFPKEERAALVRANRTNSTCPHHRTCASTGSSPTLPHWSRPRPESWSSTLGAWSCPRGSPVPTMSRTPTDRAEPLPPGGFRSLNWRAELMLIGADPGAATLRDTGAPGSNNIVHDLAAWGWPSCGDEHRCVFAPPARLVPSRRAPRVTMVVRRAR